MLRTFKFFFTRTQDMAIIRTNDQAHVASLEDKFYKGDNKAYVFEIKGDRSYIDDSEIGPDWSSYEEFQAWEDAGGWDEVAAREE